MHVGSLFGYSVELNALSVTVAYSVQSFSIFTPFHYDFIVIGSLNIKLEHKLMDYIEELTR